MNGKIVLQAQSLDGFLTEDDKKDLFILENIFLGGIKSFDNFGEKNCAGDIINLYDEVGKEIKRIISKHPRIKVYPFEMDKFSRAEANRIVSKLRDEKTGHEEFMYYTQRAYEMLFRYAYMTGSEQTHKIVRTPVNIPVQNYAMSEFPNINTQVGNSVMCVLLRAALLPSLVVAKEIEDYSSNSYQSPFALFKISRNDKKNESDMEYILDLDKSFFNLETLDGKDLIFADPMDATGGTLIATIKYLTDNGVKPASVSFFNIISTLKGAIRVTRAIENLTCHTLWMDPLLNEKAYIMPGLGDAGDRINGTDSKEKPRNVIQLCADYGKDICSLYRNQLFQIEKTVLG